MRDISDLSAKDEGNDAHRTDPPCLRERCLVTVVQIAAYVNMIWHTNGYSLRVVGVSQSRGTVQIVSTLSCVSGGPGPDFLGGNQSCNPAAWLAERQLLAGDIESNTGPKPTLKPFYTHSL